jgi:hypothetical protein
MTQDKIGKDKTRKEKTRKEQKRQEKKRKYKTTQDGTRRNELSSTCRAVENISKPMWNVLIPAMQNC